MGLNITKDPDLTNLVVVVLVTVSLNACHICAMFESNSLISLLIFCCYSLYFAFVASRLKFRPLLVILASVLIFVFVGFVIGVHFGISPVYGMSFGVMQGLFYPLVLWPVSIVWSPNSFVWLLSATSTWTCMNVILSWMYGIAVTLPIQLYRFPLLLQPISLFGFAALDGFVIACNCLLGSFFHSFTEEHVSFSRRALPLARLGILVSLWFLLANGLWWSYDGNESLSVTVATISPGYRFEGNLTDLLQLTREASVSSQFIVWPETYIRPPDMSCEEFISREISPSVSDLNVYIVIGCYEKLSTPLCADANLAITLGPGGHLLGSYGKEHPVSMIGEKSCMRSGYRSYEAMNDVFFSTLICYDMDFGDSAAIVADMGSSLILNPSEDWAAARGHFAASVFRAVENRVAVAKADWGWDSAIIDPLGRIVAIYDTESIHRETLQASVPLYTQTKSNLVRQVLFPAICVLASFFCFSKSLRIVLRSRVSALETPMLL